MWMWMHDNKVSVPDCCLLKGICYSLFVNGVQVILFEIDCAIFKLAHRMRSIRTNGASKNRDSGRFFWLHLSS